MNLEKYTICNLISNSIKNYPEKIALSYVDEDGLNYKSLGSEIEHAAGILETLEVSKGDKVALLGENSPEWGVAYLSTVIKGAVIVPILPEFHPNEILTVLKHSESKVVFITNRQYARIGTQLEENGYTSIILDSLFEKEIKKDSAIPKPVCFPCDNNAIDESDLAAIIYTSGTTGNSKGVMLSHKNISWMVSHLKDMHNVVESDRFVSILPMSHTYENSLGFLLPLHKGASVYYLRRQPTPPSILMEAFRKIKPTTLLTVPMIIEKIYKRQVLPKFNKSAITRNLFKFVPTRILLNRLAGIKLAKVFGGEVRFFGIGGSKLDGTIEKYLREAKFPYAIGYGLTETAPVLAGTSPEYSIYQGAGPALLGVDLKLININSNTGEGEIVGKGPNVMQGYYKNEAATKEVFTEDGYFRTGDLGYFDKKGNLYIRGRIKNVILGTNGENIYPEEIESVINEIEAVEESLVVQMQGKMVAMVNINLQDLENKMLKLNERVVEITQETMDEVMEEIQTFVNQRVNKFSRIQKVIFQPVPFEKTATRKIKRFLYGDSVK